MTRRRLMMTGLILAVLSTAGPGACDEKNDNSVHTATITMTGLQDDALFYDSRDDDMIYCSIMVESYSGLPYLTVRIQRPGEQDLGLMMIVNDYQDAGTYQLGYALNEERPYIDKVTMALEGDYFYLFDEDYPDTSTEDPRPTLCTLDVTEPSPGWAQMNLSCQYLYPGSGSPDYQEGYVGVEPTLDLTASFTCEPIDLR